MLSLPFRPLIANSVQNRSSAPSAPPSTDAEFTSVQPPSESTVNEGDDLISEAEFITYRFPIISQAEDFTTYPSMRMPPEIKSLRRKSPFPIPRESNDELSGELLREIFGGKEGGDGIYFCGGSKYGHELESYLLINTTFELLAPTIPGHNGAQISCFPEGLASFQDTFSPSTPFPVFTGNDGSYKYMGHYTEFRHATNLASKQMSRIPKKVKEFWAVKLSENINAMRFCWECPTALEEETAQKMTPEDIMRAFNGESTIHHNPFHARY